MKNKSEGEARDNVVNESRKSGLLDFDDLGRVGQRLDIAKWVMCGIGVLLLFTLIMFWCFVSANKIEDGDVANMLSLVISMLFSTATLVLGFVAGTSIR